MWSDKGGVQDDGEKGMGGVRRDSERNTGFVVDDFETCFKFLDIPAVFIK